MERNWPWIGVHLTEVFILQRYHSALGWCLSEVPTISLGQVSALERCML